MFKNLIILFSLLFLYDSPSRLGIIYKIGERTKNGLPITLLKSVREFASFASPGISFDENKNQNKDLYGEANDEARVRQNNLPHLMDEDELETKT